MDRRCKNKQLCLVKVNSGTLCSTYMCVRACWCVCVCGGLNVWDTHCRAG